MQRKSVVTVVVSALLCLTILSVSAGGPVLYLPVIFLAASSPASVIPQSGQTTSFAVGDDGDLKKGVTWPNPRFTDNNNGTVTDNLTGLVWLKDADCFPLLAWATALTAATTLNSGECSLTDGSVAGDWRLPNVREMQSLVHYGFANPAVPNTAGTGQWSESDPFNGVSSYLYWTSTTHAWLTSSAWLVLLYDGGGTILDKANSTHLWPVRDGQ